MSKIFAYVVIFFGSHSLALGSDSYIVKLNRTETPQEFFTRTGYSGRVLDANSSSRTLEVYVPAGFGLMSAAEQMDAVKQIDYFEKNIQVSIDFGPKKPSQPNDPAAGQPEQSYNDKHASKLWAMEGVEQRGSIRATHAKYHLRNRSLEQVVVGVLDTGVEYGQEDLVNVLHSAQLNGRLSRGVNAIDRDKDPIDDHSHGTHVSATIAAQADNRAGIMGVASNAKIFPLKFLSSKGSGDTADAIYALDQAYEVNDIKLINHSWGGEGSSRALEEAFERGREKNILMVVAAGNSSSSNDLVNVIPANIALDNVISVGAISYTSELAMFSNYGKATVHLTAPGVGIFSALNMASSAYDLKSGTSMAAPHVSGVAAVIWGLRPEWSYRQVRAQILNNVRPLGGLSSKISTGGTLDLYRAVKDL